MHRTTDELLVLLDGEAAPEVTRHVTGCERCTAELERLGELRTALRELPAIEPPEGGWSRVIEAVAADRRRTRHRRLLAAAAAVVVAASLTAAGLVSRQRTIDRPGVQVVEAEDVIDHLMTASRELEEVLQIPALRSRVLTPREAALIVALEDDIALIDSRLAARGPELSSDQAMALWTDRVGLLDELLQARGGSPPLAGFQRARFNGERR
jgi:anti-sigma factor RsiW